MDHETSATNMVTNSFNQNSSELGHDVDSTTPSRDSKNIIRVKSSHQNGVLDIEESLPHVKLDDSIILNKQNQTYTVGHSKQASYSQLQQSNEDGSTSGKIDNFTGSQKKTKSQFHKKRSVILLESIIQREPYVKKLLTYLPQGNYCLANVFRQKSILSVDVKLAIKGEEMIKSRKIGGCLEPSYEVFSQNQRQNTLGLVKSNLSGSIFNVYQNTDLNEQRLAATICYQDGFNFTTGPRSVEMYILHPDQSVQDLILSGQTKNLKEIFENGAERKIKRLKNREPEWRQNGYFLDFGTEVLPSVKNTILQDQNGNVLIGLYKVNTDEFELLAKQGVSAYLAFCFTQSSLTFKIACQ